MSYLPSKRKVAVIGDELFVQGFLTSGISAGYSIDLSRSEDHVKEEVRKTIAKAFEDKRVGVVIVQSSLKKFVQDFRETSIHPLIVFIPSGREAGEMNVKEHYASLIRTYLGISLEV